MFIASAKKAENIVEYLIYMYNIEDIVRKFDLDEERLLEEYVSKILPNPSFKQQYGVWYSSICQELKRSGKKQKGHILEVEEVLLELVYLHQSLLTITHDAKYESLFNQALGDIEFFRSKSNQSGLHVVELAVYAMNMKLQFKMRGQDLSSESEEAFDRMRILLAYLAREYKRMKEGNFGFSSN